MAAGSVVYWGPEMQILSQREIDAFYQHWIFQNRSVNAKGSHHVKGEGTEGRRGPKAQRLSILTLRRAVHEGSRACLEMLFSPREQS